MISIIICSIDKQLLANVKKNIDQTVGIPYEIIAIDNRNSHSGICEVYNRGLAQAKFDLLCFMHEDIVIDTKGWGNIVADLLKKGSNIGLVGIAGSYYKPIVPSGWNVAVSNTDCIYIKQGNRERSFDKFRLYNINPFGTKTVEVATIDGVWFCTTKEIANKYKFDAQTLQGFHCYDIDFSLAVGRDYKVMVTYDVLLTHYSEGNFDRTWMIETLKLHNKWKDYLPVQRAEMTQKETAHIEKLVFRHFLRQLIDFNLPLSLVKDMLLTKAFLNKLPFGLWLNLNFHLFKYWKRSRTNPDYKPSSYL